MGANIKEPAKIPISASFFYDPAIIAKSISAGLSIIGEDMKVVWQNRVYDEWFGPISGVEGRYCYQIYGRRKRICAGCPTLKIFKDECGQCVAIRRGIKINGGRARCFRLTASPIKDQSGRVVQVLELAEDVTEQAKSEKEIKKRLTIVTKELNFFSRLDKDFVSLQDLSLDKILEQCADIAQSILGSGICCLRLLDSARNVLVTKVSRGLDNGWLGGGEGRRRRMRQGRGCKEADYHR